MITNLADLAGMLGPSPKQIVIPDAVNARLNECGLTMVQTCSAAPEPYDVFKDGKPAGYLRVRWSGFTVDFPTASDECLYDDSVDGFAAFSDAEREPKMLMAVDLILARLARA